MNRLRSDTLAGLVCKAPIGFEVFTKYLKRVFSSIFKRVFSRYNGLRILNCWTVLIMPRKVRLYIKSFMAMITLKGFAGRMRLHVSSQV